MKMLNNIEKLIALVFLILTSISFALCFKNMGVAISIVLLIFIPLVCYFFYRKSYYALVVLLFDYKIGGFVIESNDAITRFAFKNNYIKLILIAYFIFRLIYIIYSIVSNYLLEKNKKTSDDSYSIIENALKRVFKNQKIINILKYEVSIFAYFFIFWRRDKINNKKIFSYANKSGSLAIYVALIGVAIFEIGATHVILLKYFNIWVSLIFLYLNVYTFIFLIAHTKAMFLRPIEIENNQLFLKNGLFANASVDISNIENIDMYRKDLDYKRKDFFKFSLIKKLESHNIKLMLKNEIKIDLIYGLSKLTKEIYLFIDEKDEFYKLINEKIS